MIVSYGFFEFFHYLCFHSQGINNIVVISTEHACLGDLENVSQLPVYYRHLLLHIISC